MSQLSSLKPLATAFFALFVLSACGGGGGGAAATPTDAGTDNTGGVTCDANQTLVSNDCVSNEVLAFQTDEYSKSGALAGVKAAEAYANISALTGANVKEAGEGQIVSIVSGFGFHTSHQEFSDGTNDGAVFNSIYDAKSAIAAITDTNGNGTVDNDDRLYISNADITDTARGNCNEVNLCHGTQYASLIAGRKGGTGTDQMHGIAYNAQLQGISITSDGTQLTEVELITALNQVVGAGQGVGADIIAMNHVWDDYSSDGAGAINDTELAAWQAAVSGTNKTIMVFSSGGDGYNSENGSKGVGNGNHPGRRAAYPALHAETDVVLGYGADGVSGGGDDVLGDFTGSGRWLVVTGLDGDAILASANGCGVAMGFCLAAPGNAVHVANSHASNNNSYTTQSNTGYASSTVAGALAVLKGAFPNATPEQLTELVLDTADYIALADETADAALIQMVALKDGSASPAMRKINEVYGYGKLNLQAATSASATSYVTASNNESIGALWQDTKLTLSSHFGGNFESVKFGIGDAYGRHFITNAPQTTSAPVAVSLDDYIGNLLGENVQSQKLGGQAQANYSNNGNQSWMNLEYVSGNATTKIAFQDSYKVNPLSDTGTTTILRANNIRPASSNIGMMDVDYQLGSALTLSSYLARGEYDTGYKFDELGTDFDVNYKDFHLNIAIGNIREHGQFLGTNTSGAYVLNAPSVSRFTDVTYGHDLGKFNIYANYINYETDVDMLHDQFASIDGLQADQYQIGFTGKDLISKDDSLNVALITKLGVTNGTLNQNTVLGYTADGAFNNASQSYDLAVNQRHQQFEITYQGRLYQNADKISALRDNRFFTSIKVDSNLNHVQGASQVEIVSGINVRY